MNQSYRRGYDSDDMICDCEACRADLNQVDDHLRETEQTNNSMDEMMRQSADRLYRIPVFLSRPNVLNAVQEAFMRRLIREIRRELLFPRTLPRTEQYPETVLENVRRLVNSSYGLVATNLKQLEVDVLGTNTGRFPTPRIEWLGSEFLQIEPSMAYQRGLPLLLIRERGVEGTGIWSPGIAPFLIFLEWDPSQPLNEFFNSNAWKEVLKNWAHEVRNGYYIQTEPEFRYKSC
ncbi:hypothetical protein JOC94_004241 [Bacillus thermophilus]|uniref:Uncharacterized protein n=1 Tax=Siminovitchia thermophila TaxID=1245522 RepID=A0ABS2RC32_9BACI|nr:hypothetical protein [Siminovitchia thermophila]MBM7717216.1 hypothetical protein [Siminovitchia thermophila]